MTILIFWEGPSDKYNLKNVFKIQQNNLNTLCEVNAKNREFALPV